MGHQTKPRNPRWRSRFEYDLTANVRRARDGEPDKAWAVLKYFRDTVQKGENVHPEVLKYLAEAVGKMLDGKPVDKALGLTHRRGRKKKEGELDLEVGHEVWRLIQQGCKYEAAIVKVKEDFSKSKKSVEDAYKAYREVNDTDYHPSQSPRNPSKPK